jgi:Phage derived protein Gp49-like (DUF891)
LKIKVLKDARFRILATCEGDACPVEYFLLNGERSTKASRLGLLQMFDYVAQKGLQDIPSAWFHEADKSKGIYEFKKGSLRVFFFKGQGRDIAVCTAGILKSGQKADKASVLKAATLKVAYFSAINNNTCEVSYDEKT